MTKFNVDDLNNECFGGEEKISISNIGGGINMKNMKEKNRNGYLLFY